MALAIVVQRCAIHTKDSPNTFCGVVQELHECLAPVVNEGDLLNMEIMGEPRRGLMAPTPPKRAPSPTLRAEETTSAPAPYPPPTSKPEGAVSPKELTLVPRRWPLPPPRFAPLGMDDLKYHPWKTLQACGEAHRQYVGPHCFGITADDCIAYAGY